MLHDVRCLSNFRLRSFQWNDPASLIDEGRRTNDRPVVVLIRNNTFNGTLSRGKCTQFAIGTLLVAEFCVDSLCRFPCLKTVNRVPTREQHVISDPKAGGGGVGTIEVGCDLAHARRTFAEFLQSLDQRWNSAGRYGQIIFIQQCLSLTDIIAASKQPRRPIVPAHSRR